MCIQFSQVCHFGKSQGLKKKVISPLPLLGLNSSFLPSFTQRTPPLLLPSLLLTLLAQSPSLPYYSDSLGSDIHGHKPARSSPPALLATNTLPFFFRPMHPPSSFLPSTTSPSSRKPMIPTTAVLSLLLLATSPSTLVQAQKAGTFEVVGNSGVSAQQVGFLSFSSSLPSILGRFPLYYRIERASPLGDAAS